MKAGMISFETTLIQFLQELEQRAKNRLETDREVIKFWQDSFHQYIAKMKLPKEINDNPRRYFHLHAMNYVLRTCSPTIVWNLCVGNIKTSIPVLEQFLEVASQKQTSCYIINIDFVPELKSFNTKFLSNYFPASKRKQVDSLEYLENKNIKIFTITGALEDYFELFTNYFKVDTHDQVILCLDGISNVAVKPDNWLGWWNKVNEILKNHFIGWYFTWLEPDSLSRKFDFYYNVVLIKQKIPLHWLEITKLDLLTTSNDQLSCTTTLMAFAKLEPEILTKVLTDQDISHMNLLFRFFTDESKTVLVYQALYLQESNLEKLVHKEGTNYIGHKEIDKVLFDLSDDFYTNKEQNFVKSIPFMVLQRKDNERKEKIMKEKKKLIQNKDTAIRK